MGLIGIPELDTKDGTALRTPRAWTSFTLRLIVNALNTGV